MLIKLVNTKRNYIRNYYNVGISFFLSGGDNNFFRNVIFYSYKYKVISEGRSEIIVFLIIIVRAVEQVKKLQRNFYKTFANFNAVEEIKVFLKIFS